MSPSELDTKAVKDFIDALHITVTIWLLLEWYKTQRRLDATCGALRILGAVVLISSENTEKKP
jgi:hypothetical protein